MSGETRLSSTWPAICGVWTLLLFLPSRSQATTKVCVISWRLRRLVLSSSWSRHLLALRASWLAVSVAIPTLSGSGPAPLLRVTASCSSPASSCSHSELTSLTTSTLWHLPSPIFRWRQDHEEVFFINILLWFLLMYVSFARTKSCWQQRDFYSTCVETRSRPHRHTPSDCHQTQAVVPLCLFWVGLLFTSLWKCLAKQQQEWSVTLLAETLHLQSGRVDGEGDITSSRGDGEGDITSGRGDGGHNRNVFVDTIGTLLWTQ